MEYRYFGKTNKKVSAITCGGMRLKHGWDEPRDEIPRDTLEETIDVIQSAFKLGINHIETAYGYKKSEHAFGLALNNEVNIKRDSYFLMTKGSAPTASDMRKRVEGQLIALKTDYVDFYGYHGINNHDIYKESCKTGGPVEELIKMKQEGLIHHIGFSTHAPLEVIIDTISTNLFEFVNLHYYYFFQRNKGAIDLAQTKGMGVFIISPNDKGGQLSKAPKKLRDLTAPLTPIQWNARFCLSNPAIHTLSFGFPLTSPFNEVEGIFPASVPLSPQDALIKHKLEEQTLLDPYAGFDGFCMLNDPSGINIPEVLRFRKMLKCYNMETFGKYRYNMFQPNDHWFPGEFPTEENLAKVDVSKCPDNIPIIDLLRETHELLYKEKKKS